MKHSFMNELEFIIMRVYIAQINKPDYAFMISIRPTQIFVTNKL